MKTKQATINLKFKAYMSPREVEKAITFALHMKGFRCLTFRYTFFESQWGIADMPKNLILALFMCEKPGFGWYLPQLSGKYVFRFRDNWEKES